MNDTNDKQRQIQDCFSPGGGSAVKAVTKVEHQHHVRPCMDREVSEGECGFPEELKNCIFETQFARFGTYLLATFY